jgi:hypothetical protein
MFGRAQTKASEFGGNHFELQFAFDLRLDSSVSVVGVFVRLFMKV